MPVIIVTGAEDDDGSKNTALAAGASDFITKPFESVQLLARAQAQAKQQRTQQALQDSEASKQQLEETSSVDALTGLANQRAFNAKNYLLENGQVGRDRLFIVAPDIAEDAQEQTEAGAGRVVFSLK